MAIQEVTAFSVAANPTWSNPQARAYQAAALPQASQNAQRGLQDAQTDTVTISAEALQKSSAAASPLGGR